MRSMLIICTVLYIFKEEGHALKCYQCLDCYYPQSTDLMECSSLPDAPEFGKCQSANKQGSGIVMRQCALAVAPTGCQDAGELRICVCDTEGCNNDNTGLNPGPPGATIKPSGLKCYICADCDNPVNLMECPSELDEICSIIKANGMIMRSCGVDLGLRCGEVQGTYYCDCKTDGCNDNALLSGGGGGGGGNGGGSQDDDSLRCYQCSNCSEPINLSTCDSGDTYCANSTYAGMTNRFCWADAPLVGCTTEDDDDIEFCYCTEDGCNKSTTPRIQLLLPLAFNLLAIFCIKM